MLMRGIAGHPCVGAGKIRKGSMKYGQRKVFEFVLGLMKKFYGEAVNPPRPTHREFKHDDANPDTAVWVASPMAVHTAMGSCTFS